MIASSYVPTSDKLIRETLLNELIETYREREHTRIIPELTLPNESVRVDVAVVNGIMHGFELKSDLDTLNRLDNQVLAYNLIFDKVTLVVGKKHAAGAIGLVPNWWGITVAKSLPSDNVTLLIPIREASYNPNQNIYAIANLLWKSEALEFLMIIDKLNGFRNKSKKAICDKLVECVSPQDLKAFVRNKLISRCYVREKQAVLSLS